MKNSTPLTDFLAMKIRPKFFSKFQDQLLRKFLKATMALYLLMARLAQEKHTQYSAIFMTTTNVGSFHDR